MKLFSAQSADRRVLTLDYCTEDDSCDRIITFACDTLHNSLLVVCTYYDCGWCTIKSVFEFDSKLTGLHFGYRSGELGIFLFFEEPLSTRIDLENIMTLWCEGWLRDIKEYEVIRTQNPTTTSPEELQKSVWIGDDNYYASGN